MAVRSRTSSGRTSCPRPSRRCRTPQLTTQERLAVDRVFGLAGADVPDEDRQVYLCHAYCELGASPAKKVFRLFHDWLRVNPNEVVILVLEDHVKAEDAVDALESSGLSDRAFTWVPGAPAPTFRELIERKRNVLILAENYGGAVRPWYHRAYEGLLQDTEYNFESLEALGDPESCRPLRGQEDAAAAADEPLARLRGSFAPTWPARPTPWSSCRTERRPAANGSAAHPTSWPWTSTPRATCSRRSTG